MADTRNNTKGLVVMSNWFDEKEFSEIDEMVEDFDKNITRRNSCKEDFISLKTKS